MFTILNHNISNTTVSKSEKMQKNLFHPLPSGIKSVLNLTISCRGDNTHLSQTKSNLLVAFFIDAAETFKGVMCVTI